MADPTLDRYRPATAVPVLLLLGEAIDAMTDRRPLCPQRSPLGGHPGGLRCDLPDGHLSQEHYDRARCTVWIPDGEILREPDPMPDGGSRS